MAGGAGQQRAATHGQHPQGGPHNQRFGNTSGPSRFDGPSEGPGSPRPPMSPSKQQSHRPGGPPSQSPFGPGLGYDPAKPAPKKESVITNTRIELPSAAYQLDRTVSKYPSLTSSSITVMLELALSKSFYCIEVLKYKSKTSPNPSSKVRRRRVLADIQSSRSVLLSCELRNQLAFSGRNYMFRHEFRHKVRVKGLS